jgi:hypothetical protein
MEVLPEIYNAFVELIDDDIKKRLTKQDGHRFIRARKGDVK